MWKGDPYFPTETKQSTQQVQQPTDSCPCQGTQNAGCSSSQQTLQHQQLVATSMAATPISIMKPTQTTPTLANPAQAATLQASVMQQAGTVYPLPSMSQFVTPGSSDLQNTGFNAGANMSYDISNKNLQTGNTKGTHWSNFS